MKQKVTLEVFEKIKTEVKIELENSAIGDVNLLIGGELVGWFNQYRTLIIDKDYLKEAGFKVQVR